MPRSGRPASLLTLCTAIAALGCGEDGGSPTGPGTAPTSIPISEAGVQANTWTTRANMQTDRWFVATATFPDQVGGASLYVIGGWNERGAPLGKVQVYDPARNTWTTKAPLPHNVAGLGNNGAVVINGLVYVPGGMRNAYSLNYLQVYNPVTNTWVDKAPMPQIPGAGWEGLSFGVSGAIGGKLYVLGHLLVHALADLAFERYDPLTDTWTFLPLPAIDPGGDLAAGVLNKKFYVEGGGILQVYDPATNRWTVKASMPVPRVGGTAFAAVDNKLYVAGGQVYANGTYINVGRVDVYDPGTNTWSRRPDIPRVERGLSGGRVVVNGRPRLEVVGGIRPGNNLQYVP